jgi:hypothetical protein
VCPFPEVNKGKWQVSTGGGNSPIWSPDDRELHYRSGDAAMMASVETEPTFKPGKSIALFPKAFAGRRSAYSTTMAYWDVSPDGKRFMMLKEAGTEAPRKINIVTNWFEELKERVPADYWLKLAAAF